MSTLYSLGSGSTLNVPDQSRPRSQSSSPSPRCPLAHHASSNPSTSSLSATEYDVTSPSPSRPTSAKFHFQDRLVTWDGPEDPANPKNWSMGQKWATSLIVSGFAFLSPLCSSITAPALSTIGEEFRIPEGAQRQLILSIFLLAYAIGPFVLSPCSEVWGRVPVLRFGNMVFIVFTCLCGAATSQGQITAFRFLAGLGGSASVGMGSGVLTDCWRSEERGRGIAIYQLAGVLGPAVGPILGGYLTQYTSWRWCFYTIVLLNVLVQVIAAFFLRETYAPRLLLVKARALRERTNDPSWRTEGEMAEPDRTFGGMLRVTLSRPWVMLGTQPIIQILALYQAFNFGTLYLLISGFPDLFEIHYGMSRGRASLNYLSLAVGSLVGVAICAPAMDWVYAAMKRRYGIAGDEPGRPEFRMPLMVPASLVTPCALFLYGWSAHAKWHYLVPDIGAAMFAGSSIICYQCISAYVSDAYSLHSASASAACAFMRSVVAFMFPLFVPALFGSLGYGLGGSVIAVIAIVLGIPAPWIIWVYGSRLRGQSRFSQTEDEEAPVAVAVTVEMVHKA